MTDTSFAALAAAARTATQIDLDQAVTDDALTVAAYQAAIREGRTYYFGQVPGLGYQAGPSLDEIIELGRGHRGIAPIAHKRFEADGTIVEVKVDGTEQAPRERFLGGMARRISEADSIASMAIALVKGGARR